ncbi:threonine aldolase family protein [Palleronia caenipelagi]|uniref:Low specificity L-threonine aldolase n=1 Tax=Palleronia caenipelagi TaxID=2489174 RepID=A0A547PQL1_9RHOB|nr:beta-eliminating lyase-related protein [Palleronia caenipelagi]TRD16431.1 low specificity L-threonine aldolase [Palleronia caenipelagi]
MHFASDNSGPAHPQVMEALASANEGYAMPYGKEAAMDRVRDQIRKIFEAPQAEVYLVATGTAANSALLACMTKPWQLIYCSDVAHIEEDECGAPDFFANGARLALVDAPDALIDPDALRARIARTEQGVVHGMQRGPLSITTVTERGTVYSLDHLAQLTGIAQEFGLPVHMDGARFANAMAALGCTPAEMVQGVDALSFGGTKNGLLGVEAAVIFDPDLAWEFELRRKRGGHLFSKHRYLSAQMEAYLTDDLWLHSARMANAAAARLAGGLQQIDKVEFLHPPHANIIYAKFPRADHLRLIEAGAQFYSLGSLDGPGEEPVRARLVCDWSATAENTDRFLEILHG